MSRLVASVTLAVCLLCALPARAYIPQEDKRPRKLVNFKAGLGILALERRDDEKLCSDRVRVLGQLGLQTAHSPWMAELLFYTNIAFEAYGGWYTPFYRMKHGWLAFSAGPFFRASLETGMDHLDQATNCSDTLQEVYSTFGLGASIEYLTYRGNLGFYLEVKQSFLKPVFTWVGLGVDISPLIWLIWRNQ